MRRTLAFTMLASVILAGCLEEPPTYTDPAETISVEVNGEFIIALSANPTTGQSWQESHDQIALKLKERTFEMGESAKEGLLGSGGTDNFHFEALKKGTAEIILVYKRPGEQETVERKVFTVDIR